MSNLLFDSRVNYLKHAERFTADVTLDPLNRAIITHNHALGLAGEDIVPLVRIYLEGADGLMRSVSSFTSNSNDLKLKSLVVTNTILRIKIDNLDSSNVRSGTFYGVIYYERTIG